MDAAADVPFPGSRLLPDRLQRAVRQCAPDAGALDYHPAQVTSVWDHGCLDASYGTSTDVLRIRPLVRDQTRWWIDDIYRPHDAQWWNATLRRYHASADPTKVLWTACYESSDGWAVLVQSECTWFLVIPRGELRMRTRQAVAQTTHPARAQLIARTPLPIWVGVLRAEPSHAEVHQTLHSWADVLQHDYDPEWLVQERVHVGRLGTGHLHGSVIWSPAAQHYYPSSNSSDAYTWLSTKFPEVYAAPSGWQTWPSASVHTGQWARAFNTSRRQSNVFHVGILRAIWNANHSHWSRTCTANDAIVSNGNEAALTDAN